jgi:hypothetical protein
LIKPPGLELKRKKTVSAAEANLWLISINDEPAAKLIAGSQAADS